MEFSHFHFENPLWLWGLLFLPFVWVMYKFLYGVYAPISQLKEFIDKDLLPHLLINSGKTQHSLWKSLLLWSVLWTLLVGALADPRWMYHDIETFSPDQSLCILLDVSKSMDAQDVKPSRLVRARQKIEDLLNHATGVKIALIAFAVDPHLVVPLTDDKETIRNFLPSLGTDLVHVQGSKLSAALTMASRLLNAASGQNKSILIISDGGFEDRNAIALSHKLAQEGLKIHTIGVGTVEGAPLQEENGSFIKKQGNIVISKLEKDQLKAISHAGNGQYQDLQYSDDDVDTLLNQIKERGKTEEKTPQTTRQWEDHFYLLVFPAMVILLGWFRRGFVFPLIFFCLVGQAQATNFQDLFKNEAQLGKTALEQGDYEGAIYKFRDSYHQGVAQYKAGHFAEAEKLFRESKRPDVAIDALYNLGNALAKQGKLKEAIAAYEKVLEKSPDHKKAKDNLAIVKSMLKQKEEQKEKDKKKDDQKKDDKKKAEERQGDNTQNKDNSSKDGSASKDQQKQMDQKAPSSKNSSKEKDSSKREPNENKEPTQDQSSLKENEGNQDEEKMKNKAVENKGQGNTKEEKKRENENPKNKNKDKGEGSEKEQESSQEPLSNMKEPLSKEGKKAFSNQQMDSHEMSNPQVNSEKVQLDRDADQWLDQITNDPTSFLKNQFYIESQQNDSLKGANPW